MTRPVKGERTAKADFTFCGWDPSLRGPGHCYTKSDMIRRAVGWDWRSSHGRHPGDWYEEPVWARSQSAVDELRDYELRQERWNTRPPLKAYWSRLIEWARRY